MFKLSELQTHFQDYLLENDHSIHPPINTQVIGHLEIYYDAYRSRLIEVLSNDFPNCEKLIQHILDTNPNAFEAAALCYIGQYPSQFFSVRHFGKFFPYFLAHTAPYNEFGYLSELADFEWCLSNSIDAADSPPLSLNTLGSVPPQRWAHLTFKLHPSVQGKAYEWDIPSLWKNIDKGHFTVDHQSTYCLFWRKNIRNLFEVLPLAHQVFYQGILAKKSFGLLCESLFEITPEDQYDKVPATAVGILQYWIEQQVIVSLA